jgi:GDSL-like Lipase/Acylhydrolase family
VAAGLGIPEYRDTFPARLESELSKRGLTAEVLNFAVSGYNTRQEVETLKEKALVFDPDIVLVAYCLNDRTRNDGNILRTLLDFEKGKSRMIASRLNRVLVRSAFYRFLRYRVWQETWTKEEKQYEESFTFLSQDTVEEALSELHDIARKRSFKILLVVFPDFHNLAEYAFGNEHGEMRRIALKNEFYYLDLLEQFRACQKASSVPLAFDQYHPTSFGHECAARGMADYIFTHIGKPS